MNKNRYFLFAIAFTLFFYAPNIVVMDPPKIDAPQQVHEAGTIVMGDASADRVAAHADTFLTMRESGASISSAQSPSNINAVIIDVLDSLFPEVSPEGRLQYVEKIVSRGICWSVSSKIVGAETKAVMSGDVGGSNLFENLYALFLSSACSEQDRTKRLSQLLVLTRKYAQETLQDPDALCRALINTKNEFGQNSLFCAILAGNCTHIQFLLDNNADVAVTNACNETPLQVALERKNHYYSPPKTARFDAYNLLKDHMNGCKKK